MQSTKLVNKAAAYAVYFSIGTLLLATFAPFLQAHADSGNGLIVPIYGANDSYQRLITAKQQNPQTTIIAILNPSNGPASGQDAHWVSVVKSLRSAGVSVVGYVSTDYAGKPIDVASKEVDEYYAWYGVDGIFFDVGTPNSHDYYKALTAHVKIPGTRHISIVNLGAAVPASYADAADVIIAYENSVVVSKVDGGGIDRSKLGVLMHDVSDSATVFDNLKGQAKYIYSSGDWLTVAGDVVSQAARMH